MYFRLPTTTFRIFYYKQCLAACQSTNRKKIGVTKFTNTKNKIQTFRKTCAFSTVSNTQKKTSFPQHYVFGETCVLTIKPIMPKFRSSGEHGNIITVGQPGRLMFQFSPSTQSGIKWNDQISFALSAEELGLLINQLPFHDVKFSRKLLSDNGDGMSGKRYNLVSDDDDGVFKTLTATPIEGAAILFEIDYKKDGVGGQSPPPGTNEHNWSHAPLNIIIQAGEWEVLKSIATDSIPSILGWRSSMEIALEDAVVNRDRK